MTRQIGGAFGVAVVGALFQSLTRSNVEDGLAGLPLSPGQRDTLVDNALSGFGGGLQGVEPAVAANAASAVKDGIVDALATALIVPSVIAVVGAVAVLLFVQREVPVAAKH